MKSLATVFIPLLLLAAGCTPNFVRQRPNPAEMVAEYVPTKRTLDRLKGEGYPARDTRIVLGPNGQLSFYNIPDSWLTDFGDPNGRFDSGSGEWQITQDYAIWAITFIVEKFDSGSAYNAGGQFSNGNCAAITKGNKHYGLAIAIAAGDRGYLEFERK